MITDDVITGLHFIEEREFPKINIELEALGRKLVFFCLQAEAALMYDSVFVFAIGLQTLEQSHTLKLSNVSCDREQPWDGGLSLINYINVVSFFFSIFFL